MKYRVFFRASADCSVDIETDVTDEDEIIEAAYEELCSGGRYDPWSVDSTDWEPVENDPVEVIE
jgi:hypothetical protein